jgi:acetyl-CoA acetyltransferase
MVPMMGNTPSLSAAMFNHDENIGIAYGMGLTAERVASQWKVSREAQDAFAVESHKRALAAQERGDFAAEMTPVEVVDRSANLETGEVIEKRRTVSLDEGARADTSMEGLAKLKTVFAARGSVTAGNSSQTSDGAGALILAAEDAAGTSSDRGILATDLHSDGRFKDLLFVDGGVSTGQTGRLRMQGREVFRHAVEKLAETAHTALEKAGLSGEDVDWIVPHQANIRIIEGTAKRMQVPMDRVVVTVQDHGNTSAASIPLALSVGVARGQIKRGDLIVTEAIGGGLAWGAVVLRW